MKIDNYILERLRADAAHAIAVAECESAVQHPGLRGRLREILISNLLAPWLPPFCKCVTGMIIQARNIPRNATQEDILVIDQSLAPPILASIDGPDGVFLLNSVLLRIEVKSKITRDELRDFISSSAELVKMKFTKQPGCKRKFTCPLSILVAFKSDCVNDDWDSEYYRFRDVMNETNCPPPLSGFVSAICVVDKGLWYLRDFGKRVRSWGRFDRFEIATEDERKEDRLACLVAKVSDIAYRAHAERQGRDPSQGLEGGVGQYIPERFVRLSSSSPE